jgi:cation:H+ antiporter
MTVDAILFAIGLALLLGGAEGLVRGASGLARTMGISPLVMGLTLVAFGTSAPELAVSLFAAWCQETDIAFGNVVGSNMANIGLVLGICGLVRAMPIGRHTLTGPTLLLATLAALGLSLDDWLGHPPVQFDRAEGIALLLMFAAFFHYAVSVARHDAANGIAATRWETSTSEHVVPHLLRALVGLGLVTAGAHLTVDAAVDLAQMFRVSEALIGLTLVAVGTSLPELATGIVAMRRGRPELLVGGVLGSNIFNLLFVLGATALVRPIPIPPRGLADLLVMGLLSAILLVFAVSRKRRIGRMGAGALLVFYVSYLGWRAGWM